MPVIVRMTNATKEMPPRQYSGFQYQIVLSSYFSAWLRGSCRWSVSRTTRVRSAYGTVGKRDLIQPKTDRSVSCRMSPVVDVVSPQQYTYHAGLAIPPTRFSPCALTGITGRARGAGPWTLQAPTYWAPLLSFVFTTSTIGSYWEPWQMQ